MFDTASGWNELAAAADRRGAGLRAAVEAVAAAGRSPQGFYRRSLRYDEPVTAVGEIVA